MTSFSPINNLAAENSNITSNYPEPIDFSIILTLKILRNNGI